MRRKDVLDDLPFGAKAIQVGRKTAIQFDVPEIDLELPFTTQIDRAEAAISAAYQLMPTFDAWRRTS
ncbi:hypothetical protein [uncultured Roseovarius sp.]|uniref:hypothetical protein n=1 Tax=uncultured Roseovarius sp. TaxID=293344 RepID=UPI0025CD50C2|nr:hypothetical protein [uncultured Roseovarius sp.]